MVISVVGIGLQGKDSLTNSVQNIVNEATILVGSHRHLSYFPDHLGKRLEIKDITTTINQLKVLIENTEKIVILATGDPLFFGIGRLLTEHFSSDKLQFYPHLSCVQLAFNHLKIPSQDAQIVSVHGRELNILASYLQKGVEKLAVLTDRVNHPAAIAQFYLSLESPCHYTLFVCENLGDTSEKITQFFPNEMNNLVGKSGADFSALNVVIFLRHSTPLTINLEELPLFGLKDQDFLSFSDRPNLMTKREIRSLILGELALQPNQIIWDIGAGTGSVSIEIARLCPTSQIYAIEKTGMGINLIEKNSHKFNVSNLKTIQATAPHKLETLPSPHRIFIGGTGGNLETILQICQEKLHDQGLIVMALATLENGSQAIAWFKRQQWTYHLLQVQLSRSSPIGNLTRFSPLNPVTIITASQSS
ncbi:MAG: precorrin-6y C5,15-methyltransferase (decarboxylating) subunit CbiE [Microcystaceae cyanobacterium]